MRIQSKAEAARQRAAADTDTAAVWHREADSWFDGSVESVDRRLAMCNLLLARSEEVVGKEGFDGKHIAALGDLQAAQRHLQALRRDLLTASGDKETKTAIRFQHPPLSHADRRYVALEGASFYRANPEVDRDEILIRARNHAELQTSTLPVARSKAITAAFVQKVAALAEDDLGRRRSRPQRVASAVAPGPDEWLFM